MVALISSISALSFFFFFESPPMCMDWTAIFEVNRSSTRAICNVGKFFSSDSLLEIMKITGAEVGDSIFLSCGKEKDLEKIIGLARDKIGKDLDLIDQDVFAFCLCYLSLDFYIVRSKLRHLRLKG